MFDRPDPMLTPEGEPAITDWSLDLTSRHLNHGSFGAVPVAAQRVQNQLRKTMEANPCAWFTGLPERVAMARTEIALFLGADATHTALVPNASAGASVVYANVPAPQGMEIVLTDHTYGAVAMGAQRLARRVDGEVRVAHVPLDATEAEVVEIMLAEVTERTGLIVVDHITSATGREMPAREVALAGRRLGIPVLVDAAHAPGLQATPVEAVDADFWVGNLHKFACAPRGTAALVSSGSYDHLLNPLIDSWGASYAYPSNFDHQGTVDVTSYLSSRTSFDIIEDHYGWDVARAYIQRLGDYGEQLIATSMSERTGVDARVNVGMKVNGLRLVRLPAALARTPEEGADLRHYLAVTARVETAISSWHGEGFLRLSTHVYNTPDDYEDFSERVVPLIADLGRRAEHGERPYARS